MYHILECINTIGVSTISTVVKSLRASSGTMKTFSTIKSILFLRRAPTNPILTTYTKSTTFPKTKMHFTRKISTIFKVGRSMN